MGAGACQNMSLLVIEFGVCHLSFLTWPSACSPYSLPREGAVQRGAPQRWRTEEAGAPAPALGGLPVASRSLPGAARPVGRQGEGGRDGAIRVPVPTGLRPQHLPLHAVLLGTLPGCEEPRTSHVPVPRLPKSPPPFMLPNRPSEDPGSLFWALISVERIQSPPHLPPGPG